MKRETLQGSLALVGEGASGLLSGWSGAWEGRDARGLGGRRNAALSVASRRLALGSELREFVFHIFMLRFSFLALRAAMARWSWTSVRRSMTDICSSDLPGALRRRSVLQEVILHGLQDQSLQVHLAMRRTRMRSSAVGGVVVGRHILEDGLEADSDLLGDHLVALVGLGPDAGLECVELGPALAFRGFGSSDAFAGLGFF